MVHYINPAKHVPGVLIGHQGGGVICSHKINFSETMKSTDEVCSLGKPVVSSPKHFMLKVNCCDHAVLVMHHPLSTICCIQGFRLYWIFIENLFWCSIYSEIIVWACAIFKGWTCLLWDITTEKSGLCQYAVCIKK